MNLWFQQLWLVMLGGALGAGGRYFVGGLMLRQLVTGSPGARFAVNLVGAFAALPGVWLEGRERRRCTGARSWWWDCWVA
jgi:CrcB protein